MPPQSPVMMTRAQAEEIIRNKGSVTYNGQIISTLSQLDAAFPAPEELIDAADPVASNEAIGGLDDQIQALQTRRDRLVQRQGEAAKPAKAAASESKPKAARAPKGSKAAQAADPTAEMPGQVPHATPATPSGKKKRATRRARKGKKTHPTT